MSVGPLPEPAAVSSCPQSVLAKDPMSGLTTVVNGLAVAVFLRAVAGFTPGINSPSVLPLPISRHFTVDQARGNENKMSGFNVSKLPGKQFYKRSLTVSRKVPG